MYLKHYHLNQKPFQINTDPKFLWFGEKHREAFATLKYGVLGNKGFVLLTGVVGTGKTTLINALLKVLGNEIVVATVRDPGLKRLDFFNYVSHAFGMEKEFTNKSSFLIAFSDFLNKCYYEGRRALLIIDEAQRLNQDLLEEIRLLSNIERDDEKLLNILFVGQTEFYKTLAAPQNSAIRQRISAYYNIPPLTINETTEYIEHRLKVAGATKNIFKKNCINEIYNFAKGYPRLINIICDRALLTGYVKEVKVISSAIVKECANELSMIAHSRTTSLAATEKTAAEGTQSQEEPLPPKKHFPKILLAFGSVCLFLGAIWLYSLSSLPRLPLIDNNSAHFWTSISPVPEESSRAVPTTPPALATAQENSRSAVHPAPPAIKTGDGIATSSPPPALLIKKLRVHFDNNAIVPERQYLPSLNTLAEGLMQHRDAKVVIRGYTDNIGSSYYNKKLAQFRADSIKNFLIGRGVEEERITAIGLGGSDPLPATEAEHQTAIARSVEIEVITDNKIKQ